MGRIELVLRGRRGAGGQSLAEFALVAPIFFLLVFGVIQVGLVMAAQNGLVDGVREAARRAATYRINEGSFDATVFPSICGSIEGELDARLANRVIGYAPGNVTSQITYEWKPNPSTGQYFLVARVDATYANPLYVPLVSIFLDRSDGVDDDPDVLSLVASEQMRVENPSLETPTSLVAQACP
jgi:Flp pilus assembly protein TadG